MKHGMPAAYGQACIGARSSLLPHGEAFFVAPNAKRRATHVARRFVWNELVERRRIELPTFALRTQISYQ